MSQLHIEPGSPLRPSLQPLLAAALKAAKPAQLKGGQSNFLRDAANNVMPVAIRLQNAALEIMAKADVPPRELAQRLCGVGYAFNGWVRECLQVPVLSLRDAALQEEEAQCAVNPLQWQVMQHGSLGDLHTLRQRLVAQAETTAELLAAVERAITETEQGRRHALDTLRRGVSA